jgi:uncharacterized protein (TIGR03000 family)
MMMALTTGADTPATFGGCHGCNGCWGCNGYSCNGCNGCHGFLFGSHGCSGCNGCWGCNGCNGCNGCHGGFLFGRHHRSWGCNGCCGCNGYACCGGYSCCGGCCGGVVVPAAPVVVPAPAPAPAPVPVPAPKASGPAPATINVVLPEDARLIIDDYRTTSVSARRTFVTPALEQGKTFQYTLKAEVERNGKVETISERVSVRAGTETSVTLTLPSTATASK